MDRASSQWTSVQNIVAAAPPRVPRSRPESVAQMASKMFTWESYGLQMISIRCRKLVHNEPQSLKKDVTFPRRESLGYRLEYGGSRMWKRLDPSCGWNTPAPVCQRKHTLPGQDFKRVLSSLLFRQLCRAQRDTLTEMIGCSTWRKQRLPPKILVTGDKCREDNLKAQARGLASATASSRPGLLTIGQSWAAPFTMV